MDDWKTNHGKISGILDRLWNVDTLFAVYWTWLIASPGTKANESNDKWGGAPHGWRDARNGGQWLVPGFVWTVFDIYAELLENAGIMEMETIVNSIVFD